MFASGCVHSGMSVKEDQEKFLGLAGRLPAEQVAWVLNCQPHDIPALVSARLLKPLGNPPANGIKFFATSDVLELSNDRAWLAKMTNTISQHWAAKNSQKRVSGLLSLSCEFRSASEKNTFVLP
jgi:hypothetical protein